MNNQLTPAGFMQAFFNDLNDPVTRPGLNDDLTLDTNFYWSEVDVNNIGVALDVRPVEIWTALDNIEFRRQIHEMLWKQLIATHNAKVDEDNIKKTAKLAYGNITPAEFVDTYFGLVYRASAIGLDTEGNIGSVLTFAQIDLERISEKTGYPVWHIEAMLRSPPQRSQVYGLMHKILRNRRMEANVAKMEERRRKVAHPDDADDVLPHEVVKSPCAVKLREGMVLVVKGVPSMRFMISDVHYTGGFLTGVSVKYKDIRSNTHYSLKLTISEVKAAFYAETTVTTEI